VSLAVRRGEIVAVCGAMGSGRTALLSTLFGCAEAPVQGRIRIDGEPVSLRGPSEAIAYGMAYLPEDRKEKGLVLDLSVEDNLGLPWLSRVQRTRSPLLDNEALARIAEQRIRDLGIRARAESVVATLSGGNQQKVALGKWLEHMPKVLLLDEPTRGVDVGAREEIYGILDRLADRGVAMLMASSDLTEVVRLAHRVILLRRGRILAQLSREQITIDAIVRLTTGAADVA
jgi:ABC-type sugar transport system ATPase subunit